jgi:predicted glycosyltransferase
MRTCWVLDHPAHVRLLAPFIRSGTTSDVLIATDRVEVGQLLDSSEGVLPKRQQLWVERPIGAKRARVAWKRMRSVRRFLKEAQRSGGRFERIIAVGAPLELRVAKRLKIPKRWYISDTEVNHLAHRLAVNAATDVMVPTHWNASIDGGWLERFQIKGARIHRVNGLHGMVHLRPQLRPKQVATIPKIAVRRLLGDGVHDAGEILSIPDSLLDGVDSTQADESLYAGDAWEFTSMLSMQDGVISQSVTVASEAALMGVPTLLVSDAKRGFLDRLEADGYPLFRLRTGDDVEEIHAQFLAGLHLTDALELPEWPDARQQFAEFIGSELID